MGRRTGWAAALVAAAVAVGGCTAVPERLDEGDVAPKEEQGGCGSQPYTTTVRADLTLLKPDGTVWWQRHLPRDSGFDTEGVLAVDRTVVVAAGQEIRAYDAASGALRWRTSGPAQQLVDGPGDLVVAAAYDTSPNTVTIRGLDVEDGAVAWERRQPAGAGYSVVTPAGGLLVLSSRSRFDPADPRPVPTSIVALDPADGTVRWQHDEVLRTNGGAPRLGADGAVLIDAGYPGDGGDSSLIALDPVTGAERWRRPYTSGTQSTVIGGTPGLLTDDLRGHQSLRVVDPATGRDSFTLDGSGRRALIGGTEGAVLYQATAEAGRGDRLDLLRRTDGHVLWSVDVPSVVDGVLLDEDRLYAIETARTTPEEVVPPVYTSSLTVRSLRDGRLLGTTAVERERYVTVAGPAVVVPGRGIVTFERARAAVATAFGTDGRERWHVTLPSAPLASAVLRDGSVAVASRSTVGVCLVREGVAAP